MRIPLLGEFYGSLLQRQESCRSKSNCKSFDAKEAKFNAKGAK
jgi:hypothetical protein